MCFNIFVRCINIDMSSDDIIRSYHQIMSDLLNCVSSILHGFRFMIFPETTAAPSLHRPIACATVASQWLSTTSWPYPDHIRKFSGTKWWFSGYEALWGFVDIFWIRYDITMIIQLLLWSLMCVFHLHSLCTGNTPPRSHIIPFVPFLDPTYYKIPARWPIFW